MCGGSICDLLIFFQKDQTQKTLGGGLPDPREPCHVRDSVLLAAQEALSLQLLVQHIQGALDFGGVPCVRNVAAQRRGCKVLWWNIVPRAWQATSPRQANHPGQRYVGRRAFVSRPPGKRGGYANAPGVDKEIGNSLNSPPGNSNFRKSDLTADAKVGAEV